MGYRNVSFLYALTFFWVCWGLPSREPIRVIRQELVYCKESLFFIIPRFLFTKLLKFRYEQYSFISFFVIIAIICILLFLMVAIILSCSSFFVLQI